MSLLSPLSIYLIEIQKTYCQFIYDELLHKRGREREKYPITQLVFFLTYPRGSINKIYFKRQNLSVFGFESEAARYPLSLNHLVL